MSSCTTLTTPLQSLTISLGWHYSSTRTTQETQHGTPTVQFPGAVTMSSHGYQCRIPLHNVAGRVAAVSA
eukprot:6435445-Amphidinium_carterae.2